MTAVALLGAILLRGSQARAAAGTRVSARASQRAPGAPAESAVARAATRASRNGRAMVWSAGGNRRHRADVGVRRCGRRVRAPRLRWAEPRASPNVRRCVRLEDATVPIRRYDPPVRPSYAEPVSHPRFARAPRGRVARSGE